MTDLHSQLRAYGRQIESDLTAAADHTQGVPLLGLEPEPPRPRRPLAYGVVAALLIIVVAVPLVLTRSNPPPIATAPTPELSNGWVAFSGAETEGYDIFIVREGDSPRRIVGFAGDELDQTCPTFSPDGSKLAYIETDRTGLAPGQMGGGVGEVVVGEFDDGAVPLELFRGRATWRGCPTWAPDSTRLAYVFDNQTGVVLTQSSTVSQWLLNIVTLDGEVTTLFEGFGSHFDIEWSPDGSAIAVSATFRDQGESVPLFLSRIRLLPVDGSEPRELMQQWGSLSWAPDGSRLAALAQGMIEVAGLDGSHSSIPIGMSSDFDTVDWSPDGTRLAYLHRPEGRLTLVNPDGAEPVRLAIEVHGEGRAGGYGPVWSPDGTQLLVAVGGLANGAAIVSRSTDPETSATVLHSSEGVMSDIFGMSWQPVFP